MKIVSKRNGSTMEIALDGRLDTTTAPELEKEVRGKLAGITELVFDFSEVEYVSSAGLRIMMLAKKELKAGGIMKVRNANELILEVFEVTGFSDVVTIE